MAKGVLGKIPGPFQAPIRREGRKIDSLARTRYGISGQALLAKLINGESGFSMSAVSSANAQGAAQFIPGTRRTAIQRFGIDPWRSPEEAVIGARLHLQGKVNGSKGLEGYNPGGGVGYVNYILGQPIGAQSAVGGAAPGLAGANSDALSGIQSALEAQAAPQPAPVAVEPPIAAGPTFPEGFRQPETQGPPGQQNEGLADLAAELGDLSQTNAIAEGGPFSSALFDSTGGSYGGSRRIAKNLIAGLGADITSAKRSNVPTGSSTSSDHHTSQRDAFAFDLSPDSQVANRLARRLDIPNFKQGQNFYNLRRGGYRVQYLTGAHGTGPHLHLGVKRIGG